MFAIRFALASAGFALAAASAAQAQNLLTNGNLDVTQQVEIVPGFFLPKPASWENVGSRVLTGPYEDEMSSEPWAGPAPTPVTADGVDAGGGQRDWAVFFKAFSGGSATGPMTGHLYQDVPATAGTAYTLTGWAGAEQNLLAMDVQIAIDFLSGGGGVISSSTLSLLPTLFVDNGQPFDYKQYMVGGIAPPGTEFVRARASVINGAANPAGGGQALVFDDFVLVPAPGASAALALLGVAALSRRRRSH